MKPFYPTVYETPRGASAQIAVVHSDGQVDADASAVRADAHLVARLAVYDSPAAAPRVEDITEPDASSFIETLSTRVYMTVRDLGGVIPYTVIREIVENLIHADFRETVVSVLGGGTTLRFADQGPGITDKQRALLPGFTTATAEMKYHIRGVGSGLPIVSEFLGHHGGSLEIDDNLGRGTVVTLNAQARGQNPSAHPAPPARPAPIAPAIPPLSNRQKKVLSLVMEFGEAGPTLVSKELAVGLSTAYRDLAFLEAHDLISSDETGKRVLSDTGAAYLDNLFDQA
jgi:hypothetical protein